MRRFFPHAAMVSLVALFAFAGANIPGVPVRPQLIAYAQAKDETQPSVKLPDTVTVVGREWAMIPAEVIGGRPQWEIDRALEEVPLQLIFPKDVIDRQSGKVLRIKPDTPAGKYIVRAWNAKGDVASRLAVCWVVVQGTTPPPPVPPPQPDPDKPKPPPPDPAPATSPFSLPGLRVLIVYESTQEMRLTSGQKRVVYGFPFRTWLESLVVKGPGGEPERRFWDQNQDVSSAPKHWQEVMARKQASIPWIVVGNGRVGYEGPLPDREEDTKALISKFRE